MPLEIERKYLVDGDFSANVQSCERIVQGYICATPEKTVRIRIKGEKAFITIKGASDQKGISRYEFEQEIPVKDAEQLLNLCEPGIIDKVRHYIPIGNHIWEVDIFHGENEGLIIAEIELSAEEETFDKPSWLGKEVTGDKKYYNALLSQNPYKSWTK